jgi:hypothetical protein
MAYEIPGQMVTLPASTTVLSTTAVNYQYRLVSISTAGEATLGSLGQTVFGVMQNKPRVEGEAATIMINGMSKVQAHGSTVSAGELVACSTVGMVQATTGGAYTIGRIVAGSSGSTGRILTLDISPIGTT